MRLIIDFLGLPSVSSLGYALSLVENRAGESQITFGGNSILIEFGIKMQLSFANAHFNLPCEGFSSSLDFFCLAFVLGMNLPGPIPFEPKVICISLFFVF